jgi:hypothetical protein
MARNSAAANRGVTRIALFAAVVAVITVLPASARTAAQAPPLVQVTSHELHLSKPVTSLAADNGRAAFAFCTQLIGIWRPGATSIVRLGPLNLWTCPSPQTPETIETLAIAKDRIAWGIDEGGNIVDNMAFETTLANPHTFTTVATLAHCCRGEPDQERMGWVFGDAKFIAFATRYKCGDHGTPACPPPAPTGFANYTTWRIRQPPFSANCVYAMGACNKIAAAAMTLEPLSVGGKRVALRRADGVVVVRDQNGALVRRFSGLAGLTRGAELMGNRLVVLIPAHILDFDLATGHQLHSRFVPQLPSAGVCGITPCLPTSLRLLDAARGLVAYTLSGKLHLLRLRDGRNRLVGAATDARFGDTGLFYTYTASGPWPGRIRFVPWSRLPLKP